MTSYIKFIITFMKLINTTEDSFENAVWIVDKIVLEIILEILYNFKTKIFLFEM